MQEAKDKIDTHDAALLFIKEKLDDMLYRPTRDIIGNIETKVISKKDRIYYCKSDQTGVIFFHACKPRVIKWMMEEKLLGNPYWESAKLRGKFKPRWRGALMSKCRSMDCYLEKTINYECRSCRKEIKGKTAMAMQLIGSKGEKLRNVQLKNS